MKTIPATAPMAAAIALILSACSPSEPPVEVHRPIRALEIRYGGSGEANRYFASVRSRYEITQAFRVGGKVAERRVDAGQAVRQGDVIAVLDDADYRLAEDAARRQAEAAQVHLRQAEADLRRIEALKADGSVSAAEEEHARSALDTARAVATAETHRLAMARNQREYTTLRASRDGVIVELLVEAGQVVAPGQPAVTVSDQASPEIVVDVPEERLGQFKASAFQALVPSASDEPFDLELRELSAQASAQTRTYRARLKPAMPRQLPLGASATLIARHAPDGGPTASIPAVALSQKDGQPTVWAARRLEGPEPLARVEMVPVVVRGYRNDDVLISGPEEGTTIVAAGVQKMAPGLVVALPEPGQGSASTQGAR